MLTFDEARERGFRACVDRIGYEFCMRNKENIAYAHGTKVENGSLYCWVGVGDVMNEENKTGKERKYSISASCNVDISNGKVIFD